jgi:hypothetical protein
MQSAGLLDGVRAWELEHSAAAMNDAELGMANLKQAMHDPSLLADVALGLRQAEGQAEFVKMVATPIFQQQMKSLIEANGALADFLSLEFSANQQKKEGGSAPDALASLLLALNPVSARASARADIRMEALSDLKDLA